LKNPRYPIWVIKPKRHYAVLYSKQPTHPRDGPFDIYYYDTYWYDEYGITIDPSGKMLTSYHDEPSLKECIQSKWPGATMKRIEDEPTPQQQNNGKP
jgi:hypothetical protein